jgi:hypothetical protein
LNSVSTAYFSVGDPRSKRSLNGFGPRQNVAASAAASWAGRPLPLAGMVYAAAAVGTVDVRQVLVPALKTIEDEPAANR